MMVLLDEEWEGGRYRMESIAKTKHPLQRWVSPRPSSSSDEVEGSGRWRQAWLWMSGGGREGGREHGWKDDAEEKLRPLYASSLPSASLQ